MLHHLKDDFEWFVPSFSPIILLRKRRALEINQRLKEYTEYFISKKVSGKGSKLERAGLISMSDKERAAVLANFKAGKAVK